MTDIVKEMRACADTIASIPFLDKLDRWANEVVRLRTHAFATATERDQARKIGRDKDEEIERLRQEAREAKSIAWRYALHNKGER